MRVANCFYVRMLASTDTERVKSMAGNMGLEVSAIDAPHAILKLKNISSKKNVTQKLENSQAFKQVTFLTNFNIEL